MVGTPGISLIRRVYGVYEGKESLGLPTDRITLFQYGDFYESFKCIWEDNGNGEIMITANDANNLMSRFGSEILGLDQNSIQQLQDFARIKINQIIKQQLNQAA